MIRKAGGKLGENDSIDTERERLQRTGRRWVRVTERSSRMATEECHWTWHHEILESFAKSSFRAEQKWHPHRSGWEREWEGKEWRQNVCTPFQVLWEKCRSGMVPGQDSKSKKHFNELELDTKKHFLYLLYKLAVCSEFSFEHCVLRL